MFIEPGDEVIIFEPFFDRYLPSITFPGGKQFQTTTLKGYTY